MKIIDGYNILLYVYVKKRVWWCCNVWKLYDPRHGETYKEHKRKQIREMMEI